MAIIKAFKGIRPIANKVSLVASKPYDVLNTEEARNEAGSNSYSFLHVIKPEIDFPADQNPYAPEIYLKGKENFKNLVQEGILRQDSKDSLYIYQLEMNGRKQTGIVACAYVEDYFNNVIKKHELTRPDKEEDRKNHVRVGKMNAEPVFFSHPSNNALKNIVNDIVKGKPEYDFVAIDNVCHRFWKVDDLGKIDAIIALFKNIQATYVADGHHRTAAAALIGREMQQNNPHHNGKEEYNYFLAVHFPDDELQIIDYNRIVKDLNNLSVKDFLTAISDNFNVEKIGANAYKPDELHAFGLYLEGIWYALKAKDHTYDDNNPIGVLDVTILYEYILKPLLNIVDLRTDKRIDFVGGIRGLAELERRVDKGEMKAAFALFPVSIKQLTDIADSGKIMPPKTTWFEPKLRSGLVIHELE